MRPHKYYLISRALQFLEISSTKNLNWCTHTQHTCEHEHSHRCMHITWSLSGTGRYRGKKAGEEPGSSGPLSAVTAWKSFCLSRGFLICETAVRVTYWYQLGYRGSTLGFPGGPGVKNLPANAGDPRDPGSIPGSGRCSGRGNGNSLHYSCLENSMDRGAWRAAVHGVAKSWTRLSMHTENLRRNPQDCALHKT